MERKLISNRSNQEEMDIQVNGHSFLVLFIAASLGLLAAVMVMPAWIPSLAGSLAGVEPKAFWYISRATAMVAYGLLWGSMMLGVGITNKMAHTWPGAAAAFALHDYFSILGLAFAGFHALILLGDQFTSMSIVQILMPFWTVQYKPFWVGLGQIGFYTWAIVLGSFYIRKSIGQKTWRALHALSFLSFAGALLHGLFSGTDTGLAWVQGYYWLTGGSFLFLLIARIINSTVLKHDKRVA
jgi:predicted ferric reductase